MGIGSQTSGLKARIVGALMAAAAAGCGLPQCAVATEVADTLYRNGVVYTVDDSATVAQAIAVTHGRIT